MFAMLLTFAVSMTSCYRVQPDAGTESVLVYKPLLFGHGGVDKTPIATGATWCVWTTESKNFVITPITITEDFINMMPSDNIPVSFNTYLICQAISGETPVLYQSFSEEWYKHSIQATFRTMVRDKACVYKMFDLVSKRDISAKIETDLFEDITEYVEKLKIPVKVIKVTIGAITPPDEVLTETKLTAAQNQSILTQKSRADAETSRYQAEVNKAKADRAYKTEMGMTTEEYLKLRHLEIEKEKVELVKDKKDANLTFIFGGATPVYDAGK
jgi:regulator of protease activity HflC (stomatin/prohibitin superfamily)